jgi:hypothetical protein
MLWKTIHVEPVGKRNAKLLQKHRLTGEVRMKEVDLNDE